MAKEWGETKLSAQQYANVELRKLLENDVKRYAGTDNFLMFEWLPSEPLLPELSEYWTLKVVFERPTDGVQ